MNINDDINSVDTNIKKSDKINLPEKQSDVQEREAATEEETRQALQAQDAYGRGLINIQNNQPQQVPVNKSTETKPVEDNQQQEEIIPIPDTKLQSGFSKTSNFLRKQMLKTYVKAMYYDPEEKSKKSDFMAKRLNIIFKYPDLMEKYPKEFTNSKIVDMAINFYYPEQEEVEGLEKILDSIRRNTDIIDKYPVLQQNFHSIANTSSYEDRNIAVSILLDKIKENQSVLDKKPNSRDKLFAIMTNDYYMCPLDNLPVFEKFLQHPEILEDTKLSYKGLRQDPIKYIITDNYSVDKKLGAKYKCEMIDKFINEPEYFEKHPIIAEKYLNLIGGTTDKTYEYMKEILEHPEVAEKNPDILSFYWGGSDRGSHAQYAKYLYQNFDKLEITPKEMGMMLFSEEVIDVKQLKQLRHILGKEKIKKLSDNDIIIASKLVGLANVKNINEIPQQSKKSVLRSLVKCNQGLFEVSDTVKELLPLIPRNQEEYCELLPSIVRSLGIETNTLNKEQVEGFNKSMTNLSDTLADLSDKDFNSMTISQEITREDFIETVKEKVKDLSKEERQKVFDYYGFELHHTRKNPTGFTLTGYAVNLNNGKKLAQITDPKTKEVVENLRADVIKYSTENKITSNNQQVADFMNDIVQALPELRTIIGKTQHGSHDFDVMKHSLKVMQKISQDENFKKLDESDKKIMLLASLMHDITKAEGHSDKTHATESAFDTYYITRKFNLSKKEQNKLHALIKHHEWLQYANTAKSETDLTKRLQSVAFDLQQYNLADMSEIFTHADLKAVKKDDNFHDKTEGELRTRFDGTQRSFGDSATEYMKRIKGYVKELKATQPLLPITKMPSQSTIEKHITQVNPDGSTNIKGVYKDKDGLVIVKFNEVENWEELGLPAGSTSKGYNTKAVSSVHGKVISSKNAETGNIKFFVHGLDFSNQLAKFDAFATPDSDALLSVSYAERPENKYRFFRPQGVMLDIPADYVYGGGETDAGSGCGKNIEKFKDYYVFGGYREKDRKYISDMIKEETGMTDDEYIEFVEKNKDKSMLEIEPKEIRDKIISKFGTISSNKRKGGREYNEMYASNPEKIMGVFVYGIDPKGDIGNPVEFVNRTTLSKYEKYDNQNKSVAERTSFLKKYALEHDVPMYVFGD